MQRCVLHHINVLTHLKNTTMHLAKLQLKTCSAHRYLSGESSAVILKYITSLQPKDRVNYLVERRSRSEEEVTVLLKDFSTQSEGLAMLMDLRATALDMIIQLPAPGQNSLQPDFWNDHLTVLPVLPRLPGLSWAPEVPGLLGLSGVPTFKALKKFKKVLFGVLQSSITADMLDLNTITKNSHPDVLTQIIEGERVHPITDHTSLMIRLASNRRVFTVTHKLLPQRPLAILHVAVSEYMYQCVSDILDGLPGSRKGESTLCGVEDDIDRSPIYTFYSVSSIESGLRGIPCGHYLIQKARVELQVEALDPVYATLSPIPGYRAWLNVALRRGSVGVTHIAGPYLDDITALTQSSEPVPPHLTHTVEQLAVYYLVQQKQRGKILDPVGHFHAGNGATVWGLRWAGCKSYDMNRNSFGLMVNYLYFEGEKVKTDYIENNVMTLGRPIKGLLDKLQYD